MQRLLPLAAMLLLGGCNPTSRNTTDSTMSEALAREHGRWQEAETRRNQQVTRADQWQSVAFGAIAFTGIALILGSILGSRARHDAEK